MILQPKDLLSRVQTKLNFKSWSKHPQFASSKGLGRVALLATGLGIAFGAHLLLFIQLSLSSDLEHTHNPRTILLWQWCAYAVLLCTFHFLEFFTTALCHPSQATADSFLINHSIAYTAAFLGSLLEFWLRFWLAPTWNVGSSTATFGMALAIASQTTRTLAMTTAGESFNHYIQTTRKDKHVLVTHSIYKYLRHPSYVGFFFWSIGLQLVLGNCLLALVSAAAAWTFFQRRIAYEEESLCRLFPDEYPEYVARSYTGIPFIRTRISYKAEKGD
jgi:protein-S-isoprenylcysteine O-methyltransferase